MTNSTAATARLTSLMTNLTDETITNEFGERFGISLSCQTMMFVHEIVRQSGGVYKDTATGRARFRSDLKSVGTFNMDGINIKWAPKDSRAVPPINVWGDDAQVIDLDEVIDMDAEFGLPPGTLGQCTANGYI